jgi:hypothetical protein
MMMMHRVHVTLVDVRFLVLGIAAGMWCAKEFVWCRRILATRTMFLAVSMSHRWGMSCLAPKLDAARRSGWPLLVEAFGHFVSLEQEVLMCLLILPLGAGLGVANHIMCLPKRLQLVECL